MSEFNHNRFLALCVAGAVGAAAATGCSASSSPDTAPKAPPAAEAAPQPHVDVRYYPNGTRSLDVVDTNGSNFSGRLLQWCMDGDLVTASSAAYRAPAISLVANEACADGRLTPTDFPAELNPAEVVVK